MKKTGKIQINKKPRFPEARVEDDKHTTTHNTHVFYHPCPVISMHRVFLYPKSRR